MHEHNLARNHNKDLDSSSNTTSDEMGESGEDQWPELTGPKFTSQIFVGAEVIQKANDTYDDVKKEENE